MFWDQIGGTQEDSKGVSMCSHVEDDAKEQSYETEFDEPCENWSDL